MRMLILLLPLLRFLFFGFWLEPGQLANPLAEAAVEHTHVWCSFGVVFFFCRLRCRTRDSGTSEQAFLNEKGFFNSWRYNNFLGCGFYCFGYGGLIWGRSIDRSEWD
jgi:hypothetical protein